MNKRQKKKYLKNKKSQEENSKNIDKPVEKVKNQVDIKPKDEKTAT